MPEPNTPEFDRLYQENLARIRIRPRKVSAGTVKVMKARSGEAVEEAAPVKATKAKTAKTAAVASPPPPAVE